MKNRQVYVLHSTTWMNHESFMLKKKKKNGLPVVAQWLMNETRNHEVAAWIPGLA